MKNQEVKKRLKIVVMSVGAVLLAGSIMLGSTMIKDGGTPSTTPVIAATQVAEAPSDAIMLDEESMLVSDDRDTLADAVTVETKEIVQANVLGSTRTNDATDSEIDADIIEESDIEATQQEAEARVWRITTEKMTEKDGTKYASSNINVRSATTTTPDAKDKDNKGQVVIKLEKNTEVAIFGNVSQQDSIDKKQWTGLGALVTNDTESGEITYQIIHSVTYKDNVDGSVAEPAPNKVRFLSREIATISVTDPETKEPKEIAIEELTDTQDIQVVYVRSSLLSSQKVKEQQKTSTEVKQEKKQQTQTGNGGGSAGGGGNWWDGLDMSGLTTTQCETHASDSYVPNTGWH